jgi:hypothetical protein
VGEVLTSGPPDRPPRLRPRLVLGIVVVLALGVVVAPRLIGQQPAGRAVPHHTPTGTPSTSPPAQPLTDDEVQPRLDGPAAPLPDGLVVAVGGPKPAVAGRGTGPAFALERLPLREGDVVASATTVPAGLLVVVQTLFPTEAKHFAKIYLVGAHDTVLLTQADEVVVGHRQDRIFALRSGYGWEGPGTLLQVSWTGRVLARHTTPEGLSLQADTSRGLLVTVTPRAERPSQLELVDPRTMAVIRRVAPVDYVVAATSTQAAWTSYRCVEHCALTVLDLPTGRRDTIPMPPDYYPGHATFSPDGRRLAIAFWGLHPQQAGGPAPGFVEVWDVAGAGATRIPGLATGVKQSAEVAWTPDGSDLAVSVGFPDTDTRRVGIWSINGGPVRVLPGTFAGGSEPSALVALASA